MNLEVLDEPNDVAGVKRASEETEAEGAPGPKFAKFDDGASCVYICKRERVRIFVRYPKFENAHSREYIQTYFIHPLPPHVCLSPSLFRNCLHARIPDGGSDGSPR